MHKSYKCNVVASVIMNKMSYFHQAQYSIILVRLNQDVQRGYWVVFTGSPALHLQQIN